MTTNEKLKSDRSGDYTEDSFFASRIASEVRAEWFTKHPVVATPGVIAHLEPGDKLNFNRAPAKRETIVYLEPGDKVSVQGDRVVVTHAPRIGTAAHG